MDFDDNKTVSAYNEAGFQTQRLHNAWINCNRFKPAGELAKWRWELDNIFSELSYDIFLKGKSNKLSDWDDNEVVMEFNSLDNRISLAFKLKSRALIYRLLLKKEAFLRILQNQAGKGSKYVDEDEDSMED